MFKDKNENKQKLFYVFNRRYAIKLRKKGFSIKDRTPNYKFPEYDMYGFEDTPEFRNAFLNITGSAGRK